MDYMDEYDPDWVGDPKISTLKKIAFQAKRDVTQLQSDLKLESSVRAKENFTIGDDMRMLKDYISKIRKENSISNLFFMDIITKEEAKTLWDQYRSPDHENHRVADATIEQLSQGIVLKRWEEGGV